MTVTIIDASQTKSILPRDAVSGDRADLGELFHSLIQPTLEQSTYGIDGGGRASTAVPIPEQNKKKQAKQDQTSAPAIRNDFVSNDQSINGNPESESSKPVEMAEDFSFGDLLDVINPLQHIPLISTMYRNITGDTISPTSMVAGGLLFGGPLGLLVASANAMHAQEHGGQDFGQTMWAELTGDNSDSATAFAAMDEPVASQKLADASHETASDHDLAEPSAEPAAVNIANLPDEDSQNTPVDLPKIPAAMIESPTAAPTANFDAANTAPASPILPNAMPAPTPIPANQMPEFMMRALDKYETMMKNRNQPAHSPSMPESLLIAP